jgi:predicted extracellular nuclease
MKERELILCEFNVENLFVYMDYYAGQDLTALNEQQWRDLAVVQLQKRQKPLVKLWGLAKAIVDIDPDILMLVEVGGRESLENFNRHFLHDQFTVYFVDGNSKRNIDLGFLVKKTIPFRVEAISNKDTAIEVNTYQGRYQARFSRDVAELRLYDDGELKLIVLLTHLKSKISSDQDFQGKDTRTAEASALAGLYQKLRSEMPTVPVVVGGDFNANLASLELELLRRTDLVDFHDHRQTPIEDRYSLVHFDYVDNPHPEVLDYLLVSPDLCARIVSARSSTYRYKGFYDIPEPLPRNRRERFQMPSDHYPLVLTIRMT